MADGTFDSGAVFRQVEPRNLDFNPFKRIGSDWALLASGGIASWNAMTVSWGGAGELWGMPVIWAFVRPSRHTYEFIEREGRFSLSFFGEEWKKALAWCGAHSGRDFDKAKETGLTPFALDDEHVGFEQANLVLSCDVVAWQDLSGATIPDRGIIEPFYKEGDVHRMYTACVVKCLAR